MWKQSVQQGFRPKLATVAKVLLFPPDAYAMGPLAYNIATDSWWVPSLPWHSSFTGQSCQELADAFTAAGGGQPNANISNYTLFEIAYKAFTSVNDPHNKKEVAAALHQVMIPNAVAGPMDFTSSQNPRARRRHHPAGRHPMAEGHQVPARSQGGRQQAAAAGQDYRRPAANLQVSVTSVTNSIHLLSFTKDRRVSRGRPGTPAIARVHGRG
jgi:hypothetical protein